MNFISARKVFPLLIALLFIFLAFNFSNSQQTFAQEWKVDTEVTEVGRNAARSRDLLNWTLAKPVSELAPIKEAWTLARNIAIAILLVALVLFGFGVMLRRTESYRVMPYLPVVVLLIIFIYFSYPVTTLIIQLFDILQMYILKIENRVIGGDDLLSVRFDYENFIGYRREAFQLKESAEISLFLVRATTFTFFVMVTILFIRQIFLWLLVIFSPFLSIAMSLPFTRNAGKIWIGEFFRWLLYGPFFAVFIKAVVLIWRRGIPFEFGGPPTGGGPYETSINILLGGPGEEVSLSNSINYVDTYAKYVIALIMLWCAILLPFLLLRIFRDFLVALFRGRESEIQAFFSKIQAFREKEEPALAPAVPPAPVPPPPPPPPQKFGVYFEKETPAAAYIPAIREIVSAETTKLLQQMGLSLVAERANISQLAHFESNKGVQKQIIEGFHKIRYPQMIANEAERERMTSVVRELATRAVKGDEEARRVLKAAGVDYETVAREHGVKVAAIVGRPLGVPTVVPTVTGVLAREEMVKRASLIRAEIARISEQAERGEEMAVRVMSTIATLKVEDFRRRISERIQTEGGENKHRIIKEEVERIISLAEAGNPEALKVLSTITQSLGIVAVAPKVQGKFNGIRTEISKVASLAERADERAVGIMNSIVTSVSEDLKRTVTDRVQTEGEENRYEIITEEAGRLITLTEAGNVEAIDSLATVSRILELGFVEKRNVLINNEVARISTLAREGNDKAIETIRNIASTFSYDVEREIKHIEAREGFDSSVERVQEELIKVIHSAESGHPETQETLNTVVTVLGPDFEKQLEGAEKKEERVAEVSLEDYEQVKKMWLNNYRHTELPGDLEVKERSDWVKKEVQTITTALERLSSADEDVKEEGLKMLSGILPFILMGDFSEREIIVYLKSKLEAAKQVLEEILAGRKVEEMPEEVLVPIAEKKEEAKEELLAATMEEEEEEKKKKETEKKSEGTEIGQEGLSEQSEGGKQATSESEAKEVIK